ncbi:MAG TPA: UDP-galactopyranose mutase [Candidatus Methylacidiphilales bacterium]
MNFRPDCLVIGSGLTGAVIARLLTDAGRSVLVVERRAHVGGNVHDHAHPSGIRIHTYGPHYFRTSSDKIWAFVTRFADFYKYEPALTSWVDNRYENWPIAASYIRRVIGEKWQPEFKGTPGNFEEAALALMPRLIYEKFVKGYNEKQWGVPPATLSAELIKRFDVREDDEPRLMRHLHQGLPRYGYARLMERMLAGIPVLLNCDYFASRSEFSGQKWTVFTGPIDAFFGADLGHLKYRGQQRTHEYLPDVEFFQPCGQVNNPDPNNGPHIRTLEWKHMMEATYAQRIRGTVLTREVTVTVSDSNDYEYPFPDAANAKLYEAYRERAESIAGLTICGRLGEYRYYDMDQSIGRAMLLAERILQSIGNNP